MSPLIGVVIIVLLVVILIVLAIISLRTSAQTGDSRLLDQRLTKLEAKVENMPTHRDLLELRGLVGAMAESMGQMTGQVSTMTQLMKTIQEHLLEKDK